MRWLKAEISKIRFEWINKETEGLCREDEYVLNLDLFLVGTFIHEALHGRFPYLSEAAIRRKTANMLKHMSVKDIGKLAEEIWRRK